MSCAVNSNALPTQRKNTDGFSVAGDVTVSGGVASMPIERAKVLLAMARKAEAFESDAQKYAVQVVVYRDSTALYRKLLADAQLRERQATDRAEVALTSRNHWRATFWCGVAALIGLAGLSLFIRFRRFFGSPV